MPATQTRKIQLTSEEIAKVRSCLAYLQEAQSIVNSAAQELCSVPGFADEWSALTTPHDVIKDHWHQIARRLNDLISKSDAGKVSR